LTPRFQQWCRDGTIERVLHGLAEDLYERGKLDITETFIDGTFAGAKKGAPAPENEAGQGDQDHGSCRPRWSSCRHWDRECFAA